MALRIPISKPWLDEQEAAAAGRAILSGWVTQGPEVAAFEREFASLVGAPHACAVGNCTSALHLALRAVGVGPGDEVVTVSHSFIASANAVRYCGATPVFVDIEPGSFNLDPARLESALSEKTRAILCVHQMGMPCDLAAVLAVARQHHLPVVEDAACALGSALRWQGEWQAIGRPYGDIACFSFHPRKLVTTGDGGMLTTARDDWDQQFRQWRQHGMSVPDTVRHAAPRVTQEAYMGLGYNYRLTDIQAAVGRVQLTRLAEIVTRRRALAARYQTLLAGIAGLGLPAEPEWARSNWQSYCVCLPEGVPQAAVMQALLDAGIATRRGIMCIHREPAYAEAEAAWRRAGDLSHSERAQDQGLILPLYHQFSESEQDEVAAALALACRQLAHS